MTRKSARYIGGECNKLVFDLNRKVRWLVKKINRKLYGEYNIMVWDSFYDVTGVYLMFKYTYTVRLPYRPPETVKVDAGMVWSIIPRIAMVEEDELKIIHNCFKDDVEYFMVFIPFNAYGV